MLNLKFSQKILKFFKFCLSLSTWGAGDQKERTAAREVAGICVYKFDQ